MQIAITHNLNESALDFFTRIRAERDRLFHDYARRTLRTVVSAKQRSGLSSAFSTAIDGRPSTFENINQARRSVRFQFFEQAVELALSILQAELSGAIRAKTTTRSGKLSTEFAFFYGETGKPLTRIAALGTVKAKPGDVFIIAPLAPYAGIVNHYSRGSNAKRTSRGYLGTAAQKIRSAIGSTRKGSAISVRAGFSMAIAAKLGLSGKLAGRGGAPIIYISILKRQTVAAVNV